MPLEYVRSHAEHEHYAQAQREFLRQRGEVFSAVAAWSEVKPWHLTQLAGFTSTDRALWRVLYKIAMICATVLLPALFLYAINLGAGVAETISAIVTGLTIGAFGGRWVFPNLVRSDHDRYPQGRDFEHACISQSDRAALASLSVTVRNWQRPAALSIPDTSNDGVSLLVAIAFAMPFCFLVGEVLINLVVVVVRVSTSACC